MVNIADFARLRKTFTIAEIQVELGVMPARYLECVDPAALPALWEHLIAEGYSVKEPSAE